MSRTIFLTSLPSLEPAIAGMLSLYLRLAGRQSAAGGYIMVDFYALWQKSLAFLTVWASFDVCRGRTIFLTSLPSLEPAIAGLLRAPQWLEGCEVLLQETIVVGHQRQSV